MKEIEAAKAVEETGLASLRAAAESESGWYYDRQGQEVGPVTWSRLWELARKGRVGPRDLVFGPGLEDWSPAETVPGLSDD